MSEWKIQQSHEIAQEEITRLRANNESLRQESRAASLDRPQILDWLKSRGIALDAGTPLLPVWQHQLELAEKVCDYWKRKAEEAQQENRILVENCDDLQESLLIVCCSLKLSVGTNHSPEYYVTLANKAIERLERELAEARRVLESISEMKGQCLIAPVDKSDDYLTAYTTGSNLAFDQCAYIALAALAKMEKR